MKKYFLIFIIALLNIFLFSNHILKIGGDSDFPPYEFINENGEPDGFNIDILKAVLKVQGIDYNIELNTWNIVRSLLENNEIEMISGMIYSPERAEIFGFSSPYLNVTYTVFFRKGEELKKYEDLKDKTVLVQKGSITHDFAIENSFDSNLIELDQPEDVFRRLASSTDENAVALMSKYQGMYLIEKYNLKNLVSSDFDIFSLDRCFSTHKNNTDLIFKLNEGLDIIMSTGEYNSIRAKWFGKYEDKSNNFLFIFLIIFIPVLIAFIIIAVWNFALKKVLDYKSGELDRKLLEIEEANKIIKKQSDDLNEKFEEAESNNEELKALNEELETYYQEMNRISVDLENVIDIVSRINKKSFEDEKTFLVGILETIINLLEEVDYATIYLLRGENIEFIDSLGYNTEELNNVELKVFDLPKFNDFTYFVNSDIFKNILNENKYEKIKIAFKNSKLSVIIKLESDNEVYGGIILSVDKNNSKKFRDNSTRIMEAFKSIVSSFFVVRSYQKLQQDFQKEIIFSITQLLDIHDSYTTGHSKGVAEIAKALAEKMNCSKEEIGEIYWAGILHDIGKILIPKNILDKPGKLTEEEFEEIKKHPYYGYATLKKSKKLKNIAVYILHHHERWNGKGYPDKLKENEIPLPSRILCIADSWDAMRTNRSYRNKLSKEEALHEINKNIGEQFCPSVSEVFIKNIDIFDKQYRD